MQDLYHPILFFRFYEVDLLRQFLSSKNISPNEFYASPNVKFFLSRNAFLAAHENVSPKLYHILKGQSHEIVDF
jgi:hypothetical protein